MDRAGLDEAILASRLPRHVRAKLFGHRLHVGLPIAVRLNLTGGAVEHDGHRLRLLSVHVGSSPSGRVIGYDGLVTVSGARFVVQAGGRAAIASGRSHKFPMAAVAGDYRPGDDVSLDGLVIGFDPLHTHLFVEAATGLAVRAAEIATIYDNRVYARGVTYWDRFDAPGSGGLPSQARFAPTLSSADL